MIVFWFQDILRLDFTLNKDLIFVVFNITSELIDGYMLSYN